MRKPRRGSEQWWYLRAAEEFKLIMGKEYRPSEYRSGLCSWAELRQFTGGMSRAMFRRMSTRINNYIRKNYKDGRAFVCTTYYKWMYENPLYPFPKRYDQKRVDLALALARECATENNKRFSRRKPK